MPELQDFHGAVPSFKVQQVDTTGAGDAFVGALLRKIVQDPSSLQVSWEKFFLLIQKIAGSTLVLQFSVLPCH